MSPSKLEGILQYWNPKGAYGFINHVSAEGVLTSYFVHSTNCINLTKNLMPVIGTKALFNPDLDRQIPGKNLPSRDVEFAQVKPRPETKESEGGAR